MLQDSNGEKILSWIDMNNDENLITTIGNDNCNDKPPEWLQDSMIIDDKSKLPIKSIKYGPFKHHSQKAKIEVGALKCSGSKKPKNPKYECNRIDGNYDINGKCYKFINKALTPSEAENNCNSIFGSNMVGKLFEPQIMQENLAVGFTADQINFGSKGGYIYIGLYQDIASNEIYYKSSMEKVAFDNLENGYPHPLDSTVIVLTRTDKKWFVATSDYASEKRFSICERVQQ